MPSPKVSRKPRVRKFGFPVEAHELTDLANLPRRFDLFASEMRDDMEVFGKQVLPILNRLEVAVGGIAERQTQLERAQVEDRKQLAELAATVRQLDLARRHDKSRKRQ